VVAEVGVEVVEQGDAVRVRGARLSLRLLRCHLLRRHLLLRVPVGLLLLHNLYDRYMLCGGVEEGWRAGGTPAPHTRL